MAPPADDEAARKLIAESYERFHKGNHYEVLGVERSASEAQVKKAYFQLAKQFHPDAFAGKDLGPGASKAEEIFDKITKSYELLTNAEERQHYDDVLDGKVLESEKAIEEANRAVRSEFEFQKGEICARQGNFVEAEQYFRQAIKLKPDESDFWAYLGWSVYKKRKGPIEVNHLKGKAYLKKALEIKKECSRALVFMGYIAKLEEKPAIAYDLFRRALASNPENKEASREVKAFEAQAARVLKNQPPPPPPEAQPPAEEAKPAPLLPKTPGREKVDIQQVLAGMKKRDQKAE